MPAVAEYETSLFFFPDTIKSPPFNSMEPPTECISFEDNVPVIFKLPLELICNLPDSDV